MLLGYFEEEAYESLLKDINKNEEKYYSENEWLKEYFGGTNYFKTSQAVDVKKFEPYIIEKKSEEDKSKEDLENSKRLYNAFRNLTPLQASNKYMWTYLCHAIPEYRKYINSRWTAEKRRDNTVKTRFFVTGYTSLLNDNALSRLWWYGYLTYDEKAKNPFELTEILLMNQTICTDVMDTLNRTSKNRIKGVLMAIRDFKNLIGSKEGITDYFRECKKYLNHYAAATNMNFLSAEEIRDLAYDYMVKLRKNKKHEKTSKTGFGSLLEKIVHHEEKNTVLQYEEVDLSVDTDGVNSKYEYLNFDKLYGITEITAIKLLENDFSTATSWRDAYVKIIKVLYEKFPNAIEGLKGKSISVSVRCDFQPDSKKTFLVLPRMISEDIYVDVDFEPTMIVRKTIKLLEKCSLDATDLAVKIKVDEETENNYQKFEDWLTKRYKTDEDMKNKILSGILYAGDMALDCGITDGSVFKENKLKKAEELKNKLKLNKEFAKVEAKRRFKISEALDIYMKYLEEVEYYSTTV